MNILLRAGEYLWSERGIHVCDENGFAVVLPEDMEVVLDDDVAANGWAVIKADREFRGVDPETGLPLPEPIPEEVPEVVPEVAPEVAPEVVPEVIPVIEEVPNA